MPCPRMRLRWQTILGLVVASQFALLGGSSAGDILRGGASSDNSRRAIGARSNSAAEAAAARRKIAQDRLSRTSQVINALRNANVRQAVSAPVPNGLVPGGLQVATGANARWEGARQPTQRGNLVNIRQTDPTAVLHWETFNVGASTTLNFDQSAGGSDASRWIAFNKVFDPSTAPSRILGQIRADGQVYIVNRNGHIFESGSQVNARGLVASSLPINDNLIELGLLNNRDAQFLFSGLDVPGGSDGTPAFIPQPPNSTGRYGDIMVHAGALLSTPESTDGNGGRIMLVGANVQNQGVILTPAGQTVLAAGLQVGIAAHDSNDPSLRGLDVWVGDTGNYAGRVTNTGLVQSTTGNITLVGKSIEQLGALESTTTVSLNGRIDLLASYGAVGNPGFDNVGAGGVGGPIFMNQYTGLIEFGPQSVVRILPDDSDGGTVPGTQLAERSQVNLVGQIVDFQQDSVLLAPGAAVSVRAGIWPYKDVDGNRTTLDPSGAVEQGLNNFFLGSTQRFLHAGGLINLEPGSLIDVSGSTGVFVPLSHSILTVGFRGSQLADSPLQRNGILRGLPLVVDIRKSGVLNGRYWIGTPLGDVTGVANLIERNAAQLTVEGGSVDLIAGGAITIREGATIDVSGGYFNHEGGRVQTSRLIYRGRLFDVASANPDLQYEGIYTGQTTATSDKWGITKTYANPLAPTGAYTQRSYVAGANAGSINLQAAGISIAGNLTGQAITGERQRENPPSGGSLSLVFESEFQRNISATDIRFLQHSPLAPNVTFVRTSAQSEVNRFFGGSLSDLPFEALVADDYLEQMQGQSGFQNAQFTPGIFTESGFSHLTVQSFEGNIAVRPGAALDAGPQGSIVLAGANISIEDNVSSAGGTLAFTAHTISPYLDQTFILDNPGGAPSPIADSGRGLVVVESGVSLDAAGLTLDDRPSNPDAFSQPLVTDGGSIEISSYSAEFQPGSVLDVSGGVALSPFGEVSYGDAGSISILTGRDQTFEATIGGTLLLESELKGYAGLGANGGSLTLQGLLLHVGFRSNYADALVVPPDFFRQGGFTSYTLIGIGRQDEGASAPVGGPDAYAPAITIEGGIVIRPQALGLLVRPHGGEDSGLLVERRLFPDGLRNAVDLRFEALGADDNFTLDVLEARGDIVVEAGSRILAEPGSSVSFSGDTVTLLGEISAPGGSIVVEGAGAFPVPPSRAASVTSASPTVYIGPQARLSTAGTVVFRPDPFGRRVGTLLDGGLIAISGNILAEAGAVLDVSGSSAVFDVHPTRLGIGLITEPPITSGLTRSPFQLDTVPVTLYSAGGIIDLTGSEMLLSDAELIGRAGGPGAEGGTLRVFSGRFYEENAPIRTSADINLVVKQRGNVIPNSTSPRGVGLPVLDSTGTPLPGMGYFSVERFDAGGFDNLDLGAKFLEGGSPFPFGGNVRFEGDVNINARGYLRVAMGGVIEAEGNVTLSAPYVSIGQPFRAPLHPDDNVTYFFQSPANPSNEFNFTPTPGSGSIRISADLVDVGTISFEGLQTVVVSAPGGDIRGNGTLQLAGDLTLEAAQIYPTTLSRFDIFVYDPPGGTGSVTIHESGFAQSPLSAGGSIGIFASRITQAGNLLAPLGQILLGWDGLTDLDPSDSNVDGPINPIAGSGVSAPTASKVTLAAGSLTSVSGVDTVSGAELFIPYGLSPDGLSWVDPSGVNITAAGLPQKTVSVLGDRITLSSGATVDVRGGGDLYSFRWVPGPGGSVDLTRGTPDAWNSGAEYVAGDQVAFNGRTFSARVGHTGETPTIGPFWSEVFPSYAAVPGYAAGFAPFAPFNTSVNAGNLQGDPGFLDSSLRLGEQVRLEASPGLPGGTYTLLPARYALLPGAFLVTPTEDVPIGTLQAPNGSYFVSGGYVSSLNASRQASPILTRFEISSSEVLRDRAEYVDYSFTHFARDAAARLQLGALQRLPNDAGGVVFQGTSGFELAGSVLGRAGAGGRGGYVDIASSADIYILGENASAPAGSTAVLRSSTLNSWNIESVLVGGTRGTQGLTTPVTVRTSNVFVNTSGTALTVPDLTLVSTGGIEIQQGSVVTASGGLSAPPTNFTIAGDGTALRVSTNSNARITRSDLTGSTAPIMTVESGVRLSGAGVTLDSTYATSLAPTVDINASSLTLGSGQISILFPNYGGALTGSEVDPHLVLSGSTLADAESVSSLILRSYRTVDTYGSGEFGSKSLRRLQFESAGIRGYGQGGAPTTFTSTELRFTNPTGAMFSSAPVATSGQLIFDSRVAKFGVNAFRISGYEDVTLQASRGVLGTNTSSFASDAPLTINTPRITGLRGSQTAVTSGGELILNGLPGSGPSQNAGLGASFVFEGTSLASSTDIILPSGALTLRALSGDILVEGRLDVSGGVQNFYDQARFTDAGNIILESVGGDVQLLPSSILSVAAPLEGGDAGTVTVSSPDGSFVPAGTFLGSAGASGTAGSFNLDTGTLGSYGALSSLLNSGGFIESQSFRVRNGNVVLDGDTRVSSFSFSADGGSISLVGTIDASGQTGGSVSLAARDDIILSGGSLIDVSGIAFSSAGKGGVVNLEAGSQVKGTVNTAAAVQILSGSTIDLSVDEFATFAAGDYTTPGSAAFYGNFQGTLHLRAPRVANDVGVDALGGSIVGGSSVLVEGYRLYDLTGSGVMNRSLRDSIDSDNSAYITAGEAAIRAKLLAGAPDVLGLDPILVVAPGVEIINRTGDLMLGVANTTGSSSLEARSTADWDLSGWRYGSRGAPGVLTLRAQGDLVFNNSLSDGFDPVSASRGNGNSTMWLARPQTINSNLPTNVQSWSYRLTAGSDMASADVSSVLALSAVLPSKGSVLVGEFYPAVPNSSQGGISPAVGSGGLTANTIRLSSGITDRGTRYEVVRTGTGSIDVAAARDIQLRNQFATIYTAGVAVPNPTTVFEANDFVEPVIPPNRFVHPNQGNLGAAQQSYEAAWTLAGGDVRLTAGNNIGRFFRVSSTGEVVPDASRQLPNNWLYRRSYVDPSTGLFADDGGVDGTAINTVTDPATSTAWWIDFSNFFQGVGALGGGDVSLSAGGDILNADAVIPTNARMPGRDPNTGQNVAPDAERLVEWGGGDLTVSSGGDVSGGIYYVQRGAGAIEAAGEITTNSARSPSLGYLGSSFLPPDIIESQSPAVFDQRTWLPTTLFAGNAWFDVKARGDVLIGPTVDTFLLPQGLNNRFWYKTYFSTTNAASGVNISSFGGGITHRYETTLPGSAAPIPTLQAWMSTQNVFSGVASRNNASFFQPWLRLAEQDIGFFSTVVGVNAPTLRSTAFAGPINVVGSASIFPAPHGTLELLSSDGISGLNPTGRSTINAANVTAWTYATLNLSDADPNSLPSITAPITYQSLTGRNAAAAQASSINALAPVSAAFAETGSTSGLASSAETQRQLHASNILHRDDTSPVLVYATGGNLTGLSLFTPKFSRIHAEQDITDVAFYIQNVADSDISIVSAGGDIIPFNESSALRTVATDLSLQNVIRSTVNGTIAGTSTTALPGDIQISGPGVLEVLAGRNIDLGIGANFTNGTGSGITSVANVRNPFLPGAGANLIVLAGVPGRSDAGPALGLSQSSLDFESFIGAFGAEIESYPSEYLAGLSSSGSLDLLTEEQQAIIALEYFYQVLRDAGTDFAEGGTYDVGFDAIATLIPSLSSSGELLTRSRDIRTISGGSITLGAPSGGLTMASDITGNPATPPGIVTEFGGRIDVFTEGDVDIGQARIFTLRGGDLTIWSSEGDIAAGNAPTTVVTAPPTRVVIDSNSAALQTDLGGLATGGGIGVLASVEDVEPGNVSLIAPEGIVDAGDAGIRATGDITISAVAVLNADNISAVGTSIGVPVTPTVSAPNVGALTSASTSTAATNQAAEQLTSTNQQEEVVETEPSIIEVEVLGYGGGASADGFGSESEEEEF